MAEERAAALIERACKDDAEVERVRKERDDLHQTVARFHVEHDSA
jgi:hypothetical protein